MITESQIRDKINELLASKIDIDVFEDWLASQSWNMHRDSDEIAQRIANAIELRLSEFSAGHLPESKLKEEIRQLLPPKSGIVFVSSRNVLLPQISTGTAIWMESPLMPLQLLKVVGRESVAEYE